MEFIFAKRPQKDVELPAQGKRDPRLPKRPDVLGSLAQAGEGLKELKRRGIVGGKSVSKR